MSLVPPEMGPDGKQLLRSASAYDLSMDFSDERRKRQFVDEEGFTHPSKTAKVEQISREIPILTKNRYETLAGATVVAGTSGVSGVNSPNRRTK